MEYAFMGDLKISYCGNRLVIKKGCVRRGGTGRMPWVIAFLNSACGDQESVHQDDAGHAERAIREQGVDPRTLIERAAEEIAWGCPRGSVFPSILPTIWHMYRISLRGKYEPATNLSKDFGQYVLREMDECVVFPPVSKMFEESRFELLRIIAQETAKCRNISEYAKQLEKNGKIIYGAYIARHAKYFRSVEEQVIERILGHETGSGARAVRATAGACA